MSKIQPAPELWLLNSHAFDIVRETLSADLTERLIADILEVTESLMGTSNIQIETSRPSASKSTTTFHSPLSELPSQPSNEVVAQTSSSQLLPHTSCSFSSICSSFLTLCFNLIPPLFWSFIPISRPLHGIQLHLINVHSTQTVGGFASMMAAASSSVGVHQPDSHHGRPEQENFDTTGEQQGQSTYAKQC